MSTGAAATSAITSDLLKARSKGEEAFKIHKERLESGSGFFDPIKKQNLQTFTVLQKNIVVNAGTNREMILKADNRVFGNMLLIAKSRKLDMKDVLQYPLGPKPWELSNADGTLKKTVKATLGNHLEKEVANVDVPSGSCATNSAKSIKKCIIIIFMGLAGYVIISLIFEGFFVLVIGRVDMSTTSTTEFNGTIDRSNLHVQQSPRNVCQNSSIKIVFCIKSAVQNFERRQIVRNTWASELRKNSKFRVVFIIGHADGYVEMNKQFLDYEIKTFKDIVKGNFLDTYRNITLKSVFLLSWANKFCPNVDYVMSMDDDTYINNDNLIAYLDSKRQFLNFLAGYTLENKTPFRSPLSKWYASYQSYPDNVYPKFAMGAGYIMSSDVVSKLHQCTINEPLFHLDDVFVTGICAKRSGVTPQYQKGFTLIALLPYACFLKDVITGPDMSSQDMLNVWNELQNKKLFNSVFCLLSLDWYQIFLICFLFIAAFTTVIIIKFKRNIRRKSMYFEEILDEIDGFQRTQFLIMLLALIGPLNAATQVYLQMFIQGNEKYRCLIERCENKTDAVYDEKWLNLAVPYMSNKNNQEKIPSHCFMFRKFIILIPNILHNNYLDAKVSDICGKRNRPLLVAISFGRPIGEFYIIGLSYVVHDWRYVQGITCIPALLFILYFRFLPESPRWLISEGKYIEADQEIRKLAMWQGKRQAPIDLLCKLKETKENQTHSKKYFLALLKTPKIRKRFLAITPIWLFGNLITYAISLGAKRLPGDLHTNFSCIAVANTIGITICLFVVRHCGRKASIFVCFSCLQILFFINAFDPPAEGIRSMCPACTNVWVNTWTITDTLLRNLASAQHSMERKILAPAHSIVTLNTVVQRVLHIAMTLRQRYTVLTVNQALFPQLMELKWAKYKDTLIPQLGRLHISMNFLKVLGQHTADSGLDDVWKESALLGPISTEKIMMGKSYAKGNNLELQKRILDMIQEAKKTKSLTHWIESAVQSGGPDHSQEWLNCIGKKEGGIVGITKTTSALSRWALSYNLRANIASRTREMFMVGLDDQMIHNETTPARRKRDNENERNILKTLARFKVFSTDASLSDGLINIATKDVTTSAIQDSLLNAGRLGQDKLEVFVKERLINSTKSTQKAKDATLKADRNILQRLITAYQAGRKVDFDMVLQHELLNVPISLAQTNRAIRTGNKAILVDVMTKDIVCPPQVVLDGSSCLVVDGQAAVVALGKPENVDNFGQFGDAFVKHISNAGQHFNRVDVTFDRARHEEADTRVILHCVHADADTVVVAARDTGILVLLIAHYPKMKCKQLRLKAGTYKKPKYIPVHEVQNVLSFDDQVFETILPFHAITGCDTVSYLFGHSKKAAWEVFLTDNTLLSCLGIGELTPRVLKDAETFICKVYSVHRITSCDKARVTLFCKCKSQESLPPTSDAVTYHIQRAHYQSMIWRQATSQQPHLPSATTLGWELTDEKLRPKLMSLPPIPVACKDIIRCGCKTGSSSGRCSCRAGKLKCTGACACANSGNVCMNK
ncbi:Lactosylceramide 1,3-N-acetyl-beta-D-glucosaminyltransferase [Nymphon striatum]|nr:Lactosylceramide 1,3-N-acetyl-beta-D-glucosaminyltransferase [Nymphon striatum]